MRPLLTVLLLLGSVAVAPAAWSGTCTRTLELDEYKKAGGLMPLVSIPESLISSAGLACAEVGTPCSMSMLIEFVIDQDGQPQDVNVKYSTSSFHAQENADYEIQQARHAHYKPPRIGDRPVCVKYFRDITMDYFPP